MRSGLQDKPFLMIYGWKKRWNRNEKRFWHGRRRRGKGICRCLYSCRRLSVGVFFMKKDGRKQGTCGLSLLIVQG